MPDQTHDISKRKRSLSLSAFADGTAAEAWFKWVEWLLLTGALYAIASARDSLLFLVLAYVSGGLLVFAVGSRLDSFTESLTGRITHPKSWLRALIYISVVVGQLVLYGALSRVIDAMFEASPPP